MGSRPEHITACNVVPLDEATAADSGHIAWVVDDDPVRALRRMVNATLTAPFNTAVWVNAGAVIAPERAVIGPWREKFHTHDFGSRANSAFNVLLTDISADVPAQFQATFLNERENHGSRSDDDPAYQAGMTAIESVLTRHAGYFSQAFNLLALSAQPRASDIISSHTLPWLNHHLDVHHDFLAESRQFRFLQAIESPSVLIGRNEYVRNYARGVMQDSCSADENSTFYLPPNNSLVLLTNRSHHCQPTLHAQPLTPPGQPDIRRTVMVYNIYI